MAPDHQSTKGVTRLFDLISRRPEFDFISMSKWDSIFPAELLEHHHAVIYAVGSPDERRLDIEGMGITGTGGATEAVAWINGHRISPT